MFKSENNQITIEQMRKLDEEYTLVDIRDEISFEYGHIDGAKNIPLAKIKEDNSLLPKDKLVVLCCKSGQISDELAENLRDDGFNAVNLEGGKDSMLMAKLFQELKRHNKFPFELVFLVMDPGYSVENRDVIESNARRLNIPITVFETDIFNSVYNVDKYPCYLCARMRRGYLYKKAKQLGCNKIALGHHYDDVIETILMGMLYGGQVQTMMPKLHSTNYEGMELIRPLYLVREAEIKHWRDYNKLNFIQCACRFTDTCTTCSPNSNTGSKRQEIKQLIANLKKINPQIESNIFHSAENVNLDTIISYKQGDNKVSFLDRYDDMGKGK